jgi:NAD(P)-dependent dehydrogenase (short-subunit alcohol dehydrogenase family)
MSRILVTGSTDGIGRRTAADLIAAGHEVVLHGRTSARADAALTDLPGAAGAVVGDLTSLADTRDLAAAATEAGPFDVVIHNAGIGGGVPERTLTEDGLELILQVNALAPYLLTALMPRPDRLVYLSSGLEANGVVDLDDLQYARRPWDGMQAYSDSKLYDVVLAFAVARYWDDVLSNAVDPGWIRTKLGGPDATDDLPEGAETQVWLAVSDEPEARVTGRYLKRRQDLRANPAAYDLQVQDRFLAACTDLCGVALPGVG